MLFCRFFIVLVVIYAVLSQIFWCLYFCPFLYLCYFNCFFHLWIKQMTCLYSLSDHPGWVMSSSGSSFKLMWLQWSRSEMCFGNQIPFTLALLPDDHHVDHYDDDIAHKWSSIFSCLPRHVPQVSLRTVVISSSNAQFAPSPPGKWSKQSDLKSSSPQQWEELPCWQRPGPALGPWSPCGSSSRPRPPPSSPPAPSPLWHPSALSGWSASPIKL